ncbi:hypothetical protein AUP42_02720 [Thalassospira lucentensis]|uniref:Uncharacterized protein n=2 Tax=Thalassospira TaxID=168934 RepID=A0A367X1A5_9PROT|nr:hypothetical protein AUP41_15770 [Thalassospira xiamenensis]KZB62982.1 hypothetical protein AUP42_02720 [Thalassospira lucentensis]MAZ34424.1 hypothetical protein [Thalassospira sp.]RCK47464.1 hypothetical protein TH44_17495 [Thalassospira xiamenensis]
MDRSLKRFNLCHYPRKFCFFQPGDFDSLNISYAYNRLTRQKNTGRKRKRHPRWGAVCKVFSSRLI